MGFGVVDKARCWVSIPGGEYLSQGAGRLLGVGDRLFDTGKRRPRGGRGDRRVSSVGRGSGSEVLCGGSASAVSYCRLDAGDGRSEAGVNGAAAGALDGSLLVCGPASAGLDLLPDRCVRTVVTSPPYWSLRDYEHHGQTGRDDTLDVYVKSIVTVFDKVRRALADDGTVWLNIGDSYTSGNRRYRAPDRKNPARAMRVRPPTPEGLKPKDLIGVPWRLALALQDAGWWLRSEVIWHKPNAHPESVRDRPTKAHETVFLLSKSQDYYYDIDAVRGPNERRLRTVWDINTEPRRHNPDSVTHPAVMPATLARRCIAITSRPGDAVLDPYAGSGTTLLAAQQLGRRWVGIEINPSYTDLIEQRLMK